MRAIPANLHHKRIKFRGNASQSPLLYINIYLVKKQSVFFTQRHPAYQIQNHGILTAHSPSGRKTRRCVKLFWFDTLLFFVHIQGCQIVSGSKYNLETRLDGVDVAVVLHVAVTYICVGIAEACKHVLVDVIVEGDRIVVGDTSENAGFAAVGVGVVIAQYHFK